MSRITQLKRKETELLDNLVKLSYFTNITTKEDCIKILEKEIENLKDEELAVIAGSYETLAGTGLAKTLLAVTRRRFESLVEKFRSVGERTGALNDELQSVRKQLSDLEQGTQDGRLIDGSGSRPGPKSVRKSGN